MKATALERKIWLECQQVIRNPEMQEKDLLGWFTDSGKPGEGEIKVWLPSAEYYAVVSDALDRRELPGQIGFDGAIV